MAHSRYSFLEKQTILITGGTGSFGQKLVEILLQETRAEAIRIYSRDELKQLQMSHRYPDPRLRFLVGDVRDRERLYRAMRGVDCVIHAAALKQVPTCEYNPLEAVKTNILGAAHVMDASIDCGVKKVVALSSDKAVSPVNLYGATKLCAEKLFVQGNSYSGTDGARFSCVRYGNVVASRGSVIPIFLQHRSNGTIPVTDKRMTRFWITVEQGVRFVLHCLEAMRGGEVFIPRIPSMNIMDLVEAVAPGCRVTLTGIRPGEKLHEVLISSDEARQTLEFPEMFVLQPVHAWWNTDHLPGGTPLPDDFIYSSSTNPQRLTIDALRTMVAQLDSGTGQADEPRFEKTVHG